MHFKSFLENIKIYIKTAPTCSGLRPSSGSLHMSPAKVIFIKSVKVRRFDYVVVWQHVMSSPWWCGCCVLCRVKLHSTQQPHLSALYVVR